MIFFLNSTNTIQHLPQELSSWANQAAERPSSLAGAAGADAGADAGPSPVPVLVPVPAEGGRVSPVLEDKAAASPGGAWPRWAGPSTPAPCEGVGEGCCCSTKKKEQRGEQPTDETSGRDKFSVFSFPSAFAPSLLSLTC